MITQFPVFTKIDLSIKDEFEDLVRDYKPYSDFNFVSLYCWNADKDTEFCRLGNGIVIRLKDYTSDKMLYSFLSNDKKVDKYFDQLFNFDKNLHLVPETSIESIKSLDGIKIVEEPDNFDYVYSVSELKDFAGGKHKKKRNKINKFENLYANKITVNNLKEVSTIQKKEINKLLDEWLIENGKLVNFFRDEFSAINQAVDSLKDLNLIYTELRINDELQGFSINEILGDGIAMCHFEKTLNKYENANPYLVKKVAQYLDKEGCKYVNWEQDLGIEGLRQAKRSYKNEYYLKKYNVAKIT